MTKRLTPQKAVGQASAIHNRHIKRLQARNRALSDALADERILRRNAYSYYHKRLNSRFMGLFDMYFASVLSLYRK